jgi:hypothetical protein
LTTVGICVAFMVREFIKLYTTIKNEERASIFTKMIEMDPDCEDVDKNFIIEEQRKIIDRLNTTNSHYKIMTEHYRKLYLWQKKI